MSVFLDACRLKTTEYTPVWFMRQAGRYLPEYRKLKGETNIMDLFRQPEICSEIAVLPVRKLGLDAAIVFADIMIPLQAIGVQLKIEEEKGPIILDPIQNLDDIDILDDLSPEEQLDFLWRSIELTVEKLDGIPLIGFSGAPFTLASYLLEGRPTRDFARTKMVMFSQDDIWDKLMNKLSIMIEKYLITQIKYGVKAVQLFDSWAGCLSREDYEKYVLKYTRRIFDSLHGYNIPRIIFCAESSHLIEALRSSGADVISVDWRVPINDVWKRCGKSVAVQGNLDPSLVVAGGDIMRRRTLQILEQAREHNGHIFNLGHGILRTTPVENLKEVTDLVHNITRQRK